MAAEMAEQPEVLGRLGERRKDLVQGIGAVVPAELAGIVLVARGSSDHAAIYGRYVLEAATGRPVALAAPSLHTLYGVRVDYRGYLVVGVSQSGQTPEIVTVLERARDGGARTIGITNDPDSPLGATAHSVIDLQAGEERAVPATKTFIAQMAAFAILAEALGDPPWIESDWERLPEAARHILANPEPARSVAESIGREGEGLIAVARGYLYCVALEAALKIKETCGMLAQGYSAADLRHGPIAIVEQGFPVLAFVARGRAAGDMAELIAMLRARHARIFEVDEEDTRDLQVAPGLSEALVPIPMAVRAQQLAHSLALHRGVDPDTPPGLSKVTLTQ